MTIDDKVLSDLLEWIIGNRGSKHGNPYGVPEVKALLKAIAHELNIKDYLDVNVALRKEVARD